MIDSHQPANRIAERLQFQNGRFERLPQAAENRLRDESRFSIPVQEEHLQLRSALSSALHDVAGLDVFMETDSPTLDDTILFTKASIERLNLMQMEWAEFLKKLVRVDVNHLGLSTPSMGKHADEFMTSAVNKYVADVFDKAGCHPFQVSSPLVASVLANEVSTVQDVVLEHLEGVLPKIVDHMIGNLDQLVNHWVCGLIKRYADATCEYVYGFRKLELVVEQSREKYVYSTTDSNDVFGRAKDVTEVTLSGSSKVSMCLCQHHLVHVRECSPEYGRVHVPAFHQEVVRSIPAWLLPHVRLVEGTLVGNQLVEKDAGTYTHEPEAYLFEVVRPQYQLDPAIVLGQYVLTGWGPQEIQKDLESTQKEPSPANELDSKPTLLDRASDALYRYFKP